MAVPVSGELNVLRGAEPAEALAPASAASTRNSRNQPAPSEVRQGAIFAIADLANSDHDLDATLAGMQQIMLGLVGADTFIITLRDRDTDRAYELPAVRGTPGVQAATSAKGDGVAQALAQRLFQERQAFRGTSLQLTTRFPDLPLVVPEASQWLGAPISDDEEVSGALVLQAGEGHPGFSEIDEALLAFVAGQIQVAVRRLVVAQADPGLHAQTQHLLQEVVDRQRSERLQAALFGIAELSNSACAPAQFYATVHDIIGDVLDCRNLCIAHVANEDAALHFPYYVNDRQPIPLPRPIGRGLVEYVLRHRVPLRIDMADPDDRANVEAHIVRGELSGLEGDLGAWLGVPLVCANRVMGVVAVQSYAPDPAYDDRDQEFLAFLSYQIGNALERQQAAASLRAANATLEQRVSERTRQLETQMEVREQIEQQLKHETLHDFLTGLPNRAFLCDRLIRSLALQTRDPSKSFAVLFMDLDRFKVINDSAGHIVGDALLCEVGRRLAGCVRGPDMVARLGGDEFAILIEDVGILETAVRVAKRVIEAMREPINVEGKELFSSVSIGIAISAPEYRVPEELLRDADIAMYRAKANDGQRFEIFDESLHLEAIRALEIEGDLHRAIARHEFEPYFQQIVRLEDGSVIGYESLLRWNHPERGVLAPDAFLAIAEASGNLEAIDWQIFDLTCAAVGQLLKPGQYVNLNFSPRHFRDKKMDQRLLSLLREHGVATSQVRIEVTEGTLIDNADQVSEIIDRLHHAGVLTSLDDFGTGYSSLSYLHRFRLHAVKIDRSFVSPLVPGGGGASEAVVRAILALSKSQGLDVIAEGVETIVQRDALLALGCTLGQGYLYSRPHRLGAGD